MNFFEQELRRFTGKTTAFKSCKALYAGRACFIPLSGSRRARLEFVTSGVADQYDALQVTILSTADGKIDCLRFRFSDFFAPRKAGCSGICCPHIWVDCGRAEWYVAPTAAEVAAIAQAAIPQANLVYVDGLDLTGISDYYWVLYDADPTSIGGSIPDDNFYYIP